MVGGPTGDQSGAAWRDDPAPDLRDGCRPSMRDDTPSDVQRTAAPRPEATSAAAYSGAVGLASSTSLTIGAPADVLRILNCTRRFMAWSSSASAFGTIGVVSP